MPGLYVNGCYGLFPLLVLYFFSSYLSHSSPYIWVMNNVVAKLNVSP